MELELEPITLPGVEDKRPMVIAGPCSAETEEQVMSTAKQLADKRPQAIPCRHLETAHQTGRLRRSRRRRPCMAEGGKERNRHVRFNRSSYRQTCIRMPEGWN